MAKDQSLIKRIASKLGWSTRRTFIQELRVIADDHAWSWTSLRKVGHLPLMRATIFVPLLGYFILFNETISSYLKLVWDKNVSLPPTNLLLVYFGLVFLAIGSFIYSRYCDRRIDRYGSPEAFIGGDGPSISDGALKEIHGELVERGYDIDRYLGPLMPDRKIDILTVAYDLWDKESPIARALTTICYIVGFLTLAIPSARVFWKVCEILVLRIL